MTPDALEVLNRSITPLMYTFAIGALVTEALYLAIRNVPRDKQSRILGVKSGFLAFGMDFFVNGFIMLTLHSWVYPFRLFDLGLAPIAFVVSFLASDLMFYVSHRAQHEIRLLWAVHVVHHSARHYDLTTGIRGSVFGTLSKIPFYFWIPLLGVHPVVFQFVEKLFNLYGLAYHTEAVGKLGVLERILVTPANHRVHHATNVRYLDRNYGGFFILFDRLFGTWEPEVEPPRYGLVKDWHGYGVVDCQLHEFRSLWHDFRSAPTWSDALKYLWMPPGWRHDGAGRTAEDMRRELL